MGLCQFPTATSRSSATSVGQMETRALRFCGVKPAAQRYRRLNGRDLEAPSCSAVPSNSAGTSRLITNQKAYGTNFDFPLAQSRQPTKRVLTLTAQPDWIIQHNDLRVRQRLRVRIFGSNAGIYVALGAIACGGSPAVLSSSSAAFSACTSSA